MHEVVRRIRKEQEIARLDVDNWKKMEMAFYRGMQRGMLERIRKLSEGEGPDQSEAAHVTTDQPECRLIRYDHA